MGGLGQYEDEGSSSNSGSSSSNGRSRNSSSSSNSSDHPFPKRDRRCPQAVVKEHQGELKFFWYPDPEIKPVPFVKDWYTAPWEMDCHRPQEWEYVWWTKDEFRSDEYAVEKIYDCNLKEVLKDDPERGLYLRVEARKEVSGGREGENLNTRPCPVCDGRINPVRDEYEEVGNSLVCSDHTVPELTEAGVV